MKFPKILDQHPIPGDRFLSRMANPDEECLVIQSMGKIAITVTDLVRAVGFYRDSLSLPFLFEAGGMAFFRGSENNIQGLMEQRRF